MWVGRLEANRYSRFEAAGSSRLGRWAYKRCASMEKIGRASMWQLRRCCSSGGLQDVAKTPILSVKGRIGDIKPFQLSTCHMYTTNLRVSQLKYSG